MYLVRSLKCTVKADVSARASRGVKEKENEMYKLINYDDFENMIHEADYIPIEGKHVLLKDFESQSIKITPDWRPENWPDIKAIAVGVSINRGTDYAFDFLLGAILEALTEGGE